MGKLNQIIAIEKGVKSRVYGELTDLNKVIQKPDLFNGFSKDYQKKDDAGEELPSEKKRVQVTVQDVLTTVDRGLSELFSVTARKDWSNCAAKADVKIDGQVLLPQVPVTFLLFLEKQLTDVRTLFNNLPVLDESEDWKGDVNSGLFKADAAQTHRTKKMQKPIVLYDATKEHPAQTQLLTEDVIVGFWSTVKMSGAMPKPVKHQLVGRVEVLLKAVKVAREEANNREEEKVPDVGSAIFGFLLNAAAPQPAANAGG
jgi:hypothetical protein